MKYSTEFENLIETCIEQKQVVGIGNPNANILFVGKEAGVPINAINFHGSGQSWKDVNINYSKRFIPKETNLRTGIHTWQKYQKLYELINDKLGLPQISKEPYEITFVENIFTTELSNLHAPESKEAKKLDNFNSNLANRKKIFWQHSFIQQFPIVVITAADNKYIETFRGELCELFDVDYEECIKVGSAKIWVHLSKEGKHKNFPKIVLHTRQLTNGASIELIEELAIIIVEFIQSNNMCIIQ